MSPCVINSSRPCRGCSTCSALSDRVTDPNDIAQDTPAFLSCCMGQDRYIESGRRQEAPTLLQKSLVRLSTRFFPCFYIDCFHTATLLQFGNKSHQPCRLGTHCFVRRSWLSGMVPCSPYAATHHLPQSSLPQHARLAYCLHRARLIRL